MSVPMFTGKSLQTALSPIPRGDIAQRVVVRIIIGNTRP